MKNDEIVNEGLEYVVMTNTGNGGILFMDLLNEMQ